MTPIQKVTGIGPSLAANLEAIGITTVEQLATTSSETLQSIPRLGAQRASGLLADAQKIVAGDDEATFAAPSSPGASAETMSEVLDETPVKPGKNKGTKTASDKAAKKSATLEKAADKKAKKAKKADTEKTAKKVSSKAAKAASDKKSKAEKSPKKKAVKAQKSKAKKATKAKAEKALKAKKKSKKK